MEENLEIMLDTTEYGYKQYSHCNVYRSSLKDPDDVDICTICQGFGLIHDEENTGLKYDKK